MQAEVAGPALRCIERDDVIADLEVFDAITYFNDNTRTLVTENCREGAFWIITRQGKSIGVADTRSLDLYHHLSGGGPADVYLGYFQWLSGFKCYCGSAFHDAHSLLLEDRSMPQRGRIATPVCSSSP
jgi:hypothetical protein